jgi:hypothetical protein
VPARRERKGSERRKVFAQRNPEGGRQAELSERPLRGRLPVLRCRPFARSRATTTEVAGREPRRRAARRIRCGAVSAPVF